MVVPRIVSNTRLGTEHSAAWSPGDTRGTLRLQFAGAGAANVPQRAGHVFVQTRLHAHK